MKKNILIINSGGTICSVPTANGHQPKAGVIEKAIDEQKDFFHESMPNFSIIELTPLIDSSNITLAHWNELVNLIDKHYTNYDGFVILHGTDTMAYSASALSFLCQSLTKPIIFTGSQIPFLQIGSDGKHNLMTSLLLACDDDLQEVCIYFNYKLLRGNRSTKASSDELLAFNSPNFPELAHVNTAIHWHKERFIAKNNNPFQKSLMQPSFIANFRLFPSFSTRLLAQILSLDIKGLVLETYGSGNAQSSDKQFLSLLEKAASEGKIIVNVSQCFHGRVNMSQYETGKRLLDSGVISGHDMLAEAAHCKLQYLLSQNLSLDIVRQKMGLSLRGELSEKG